MIGVESYADTGTNRDIFIANREWSRQDVNQLLPNLSNIFSRIDFAHHDNKFVTSDTRHHIDFAHTARQTLRNTLQ